MDKNEWLFDDISNMKEVIRFKDHIEYRYKGKLHNETGFAYINISYGDIKASDEDKFYYINGNKISYNEWNILIRKNKIIKLLKNN